MGHRLYGEQHLQPSLCILCYYLVCSLISKLSWLISLLYIFLFWNLQIHKFETWNQFLKHNVFIFKHSFEPFISVFSCCSLSYFICLFTLFYSQYYCWDSVWAVQIHSYQKSSFPFVFLLLFSFLGRSEIERGGETERETERHPPSCFTTCEAYPLAGGEWRFKPESLCSLYTQFQFLYFQ